MNSSVTCDSATSVMSSLCLEIRLSSRSNGPSKLSRCSSKAGASLGRGSGTQRRRRSSLAQPAHQGAVLAVGLEVGEHEGDGLADQPAAVDGQAVLAAQRQPGVLDVEQLLRR